MTRTRTRLRASSLCACLATLLLLFGASCGGRSALPQAGAVARDASTAQRDSNGTLQSDTGVLTDASATRDASVARDSSPLPMCIIAVRLDLCCGLPEPARSSRLSEDPCLVAYPAPTYTTPIPQVCRDRWPMNCEAVECAWFGPPSRLVAPTASGGCQWVSECATDGDCVLASDRRSCCSCPAAYPPSMVASDPCLAPLESSVPPGECPGACPPTVMCDAYCPPTDTRCVPSTWYPTIKACAPSPS